MKFTLILLATFFCCCATAAVAQDPTCEDFEVDEASCESPCSGSPIVNNMIVLDNGEGSQHIEYQIFTCTSSGKQNRCNQTSSIAIAVDNPECDSIGGGGGGGCVNDAGCSGDQACCIDGQCSSCQEQGEFGVKQSAALWRRLLRSIEAADHHP